MIKLKNLKYLFLFLIIYNYSCTDLDQHVYSDISEDNFWKTEEEINSGITPGYQSLKRMFTSWYVLMVGTSSDEFMATTRGGDFFEGGAYRDLWFHQWDPKHIWISAAWDEIYEGIGRVNLSLSIIEGLDEKSDKIITAEAELKVLRSYYYYLLIDNYGNIPMVTDFDISIDSVATSSRKEVFEKITNTIENNIGELSESTGPETYGRINKWAAYFLLTKLYLNSEVFTGEPQWEMASRYADSIINSGQYLLNENYFDNFSANGGKESPENIFSIPFDEENIGGMNFVQASIHYDNDPSFNVRGSGYSARQAPPEFFRLFDSTSTYRYEGDKKYKTYLDSRSGQWLVGQQFNEQYPYPPYQNILTEGPDSLKLKDKVTGEYLSYFVDVDVFESGEGHFRLGGPRSIKYFPDPGADVTNLSNDWVLFRYADVILMKAEAEMHKGNKSEALDLVNQIRRRAYGNDDHKIDESELNYKFLLDERGRELAWEFWRRNDIIRFEIATGQPYFTGPRKPEKPQDPDEHYMLFPIPDKAIRSNNNLEQNPGY